MGLYLGSVEPDTLRLGSVTPTAAYAGAIQVWSDGPAAPPPAPTFTVTPLLNQTVEVSWNAVPEADTLTLKMSRASGSGYGTYTATTLDPQVSGSIVVSDLSFVPGGGTVWPIFEPHWTVMEATNAKGTTASNPYGVPMISQTVTSNGAAQYDPNSKSWFYTDDSPGEWSAKKSAGETNPNVHLAYVDNFAEITFVRDFLTANPSPDAGRWIGFTFEPGDFKWALRGNGNFKNVSVYNWADNEPGFFDTDSRGIAVDSNAGQNGRWQLRPKTWLRGAVYRIPAPH